MERLDVFLCPMWKNSKKRRRGQRELLITTIDLSVSFFLSPPSLCRSCLWLVLFIVIWKKSNRFDSCRTLSFSLYTHTHTKYALLFPPLQVLSTTPIIIIILFLWQMLLVVFYYYYYYYYYFFSFLFWKLNINAF